MKRKCAADAEVVASRWRSGLVVTRTTMGDVCAFVVRYVKCKPKNMFINGSLIIFDLVVPRTNSK